MLNVQTFLIHESSLGEKCKKIPIVDNFSVTAINKDAFNPRLDP